jgi:phosphoribosylanthranilate isomerase
LPMWVKICANTNAEDALAAAEFGADAVGFVFVPGSKRLVTAEQVRSISAVMPDGVERVGVFGAATVEEIADAALTARLTAVQLHGGFDLELSRQLATRLGPAVSIIQTLHWTLGEDEESATRIASQLLELPANARVLVDTKTDGASGGTGISFPWEKARELFATWPDVQAIVAGGLRPENVAEAIRELSPWGVDVASGVELVPGKKDLGKLKAFIENARGV